MKPRLTTMIAAALGAAALSVTLSTGSVSASVSDDDWLGSVNAYRIMSGLAPIVENRNWSAEGLAHSCYMLQNGISHDEVQGKPGYTEGGRRAGLNGNVAVSSAVNATARSHVELWMTGPFHAIGILRHNLTTTGFGLCRNPDTPRWRSGATLDVLRGLNSNIPARTSVTVFPGRNSTVPVFRFRAETPNPVTLCGWTGDAGVPLIAMFPQRVTTATASLMGPNGPVQTCSLHPGNTNDGTARAVLNSENAVTVVPRNHLENGRYTATVTTNSGAVTWSFTVDRDAPLVAAAPPPPPSSQPPAMQAGPAPRTKTLSDNNQFIPVTPFRHFDSRDLRVSRLVGGQARKISIAGSDVTAVSANFTVTEHGGNGFISVYPCGGGRPDVSTLNFTPGSVANQAIVPLTSGSLCVYSTRNTHLIIDVNGTFKSGAEGTRFTPSTPSRVFDSRKSGVSRLAPNQERTLKLRGVSGGVPAGATAVAVNITAVSPSANGFISAYPCDQRGSSDVSSLNFTAGNTRPNSAVVPLSADGTICLRANVATDVVVDVTGSFSVSSGLRFTALESLRVLDSRRAEPWINTISGGDRLSAGQVYRIKVAGVRGIPADADAVTINVTGVGAIQSGFVTVYPCGTRPNVSTVNISPGVPAAANGAMVGLSKSGELCVYVSTPSHVLIDISGAWR